MSGSDPETSGTSGSPTEARFGETHWSIILSAQDKQHQPEAAKAMDELCTAYWLPLYAYIRRTGESPHDAKDLAQGFFARFLEKDYLAAVDQSKGRFRSFMLAAVNHFLSDQRDREQAQKRGGGHRPLQIDIQDAESRCGLDLADNVTPEIIFQRCWADTLLGKALERLRREYAKRRKEALFEQLKETLAADRGTIPYAELAVRLNMEEGAVKMAVHRLMQRYGAAVRTEIAATLGDVSEIEDELRDVLRARVS